MNLAWHIVKKDLRRLWIPLALWVLILAAKVALGLWALWGRYAPLGGVLDHGTGTTWLPANGASLVFWFERLQLYYKLLTGLDVLVGYVLVSVLIHEDGLLGTQSFWRTRPISGARLLGAKLLGAALMFGVLPLLVWLPWWLYCGYGWRELAPAVVEVCYWQALVVLPALLMAVLTDSAGRFLMWTLVPFMTAIVSFVIFNVPAALNWAAMPGLVETRGWVTLAVAVISIAVVVTWQFMARRFVRSAVIALAGAILTMLTLLYWPWDWSGLWTDREDKAPAYAQGVTIAVAPARITEKHNVTDRLDPDSPGEWSVWISVPMVFKGVPEDTGMAQVLMAVHAWQWPDGVTVRRSMLESMSSSPDSGYMTSTDPDRMGARTALGLAAPKEDVAVRQWLHDHRRAPPGMPPPARDVQDNHYSFSTTAYLTRSLAARMRIDPPAYTLTTQVRLMRPEILLELPLQNNARQQNNSATGRIFGLRWEVGPAHFTQDGPANFTLVESLPDVGDEGTRLNILSALHVGYPEHADYTLINRSRGNMSGSSVGGTKMSLRIGTVIVAWRVMSFDAPVEVRDGNLVPQSNWFEGASLVKFGYREVSKFTREVKVDKFEVAP